MRVFLEGITGHTQTVRHSLKIFVKNKLTGQKSLGRLLFIYFYLDTGTP